MRNELAITGAAGFVGRHVVTAAVEQGIRVVAFYAPGEEIPDLPGKIDWQLLDVTDGLMVQKTFLELEPERVIHLAGVKEPEQKADAASKMARVNILGTVHVLESCMAGGVARVVVVGSAEEYGLLPEPQKESSSADPVSSYGISKAAGTNFALSSYATRKCPVVVVRPFTIYGPHQPASMFVADAIECAVSGVDFLMSEGSQKRDLVYVEDAAAGILLAVSADDIEGRIFNLGSGEAVSLKSVANTIWKLAGAQGEIRFGEVEASGAASADQCADIASSREALGWTPIVDMTEGLIRTIEWRKQRKV